jgi:hypothetical protein
MPILISTGRSLGMRQSAIFPNYNGRSLKSSQSSFRNPILAEAPNPGESAAVDPMWTENSEFKQFAYAHVLCFRAKEWLPGNHGFQLPLHQYSLAYEAGAARLVPKLSTLGHVNLHTRWAPRGGFDRLV